LLKDQETGPRRGLIAAVVVIPVVLAAALFLPSWWEGRELKAAREIAGVGSKIVPGSMTDARKKIDPGLTREQLVTAIGQPSFAVGTEGKEARHEIWTYYFQDGTMTVNLTDGAAVRIGTIYGTPRIPKKGGGY
jgi:flagellar basal body-associated protein FliL